jgi:hypothetical protein
MASHPSNRAYTRGEAHGIEALGMKVPPRTVTPSDPRVPRAALDELPPHPGVRKTRSPHAQPRGKIFVCHVQTLRREIASSSNGMTVSVPGPAP